MLYVACAAVIAVIAVEVFQIIAGVFMVARMRRAQPASLAADECPKVAVCMSLRGADPDLHLGLERMMTLDYPNYTLSVVVDCEEDPAWEVVHQAIATTGAADRVKVEPLKQRLETCSLLCSALIQHMDGLGDDIEVVALADGDVVPYDGWLHDLVAAVKDDGGVAFGVRWYMPLVQSMGALSRYIWCAQSAFLMYFHGFIWGGSLAFRKDELLGTGIVERWRNSLPFDTPIVPACRKAGLPVRVIPQNVLVNREDCTLQGSWVFISRQYLWVRLGQGMSHWLTCLLSPWFYVATVYGGAALAVRYLLMGEVFVFVALLGGLWIAWGLGLAKLALLEWGIRSIVRRRGDEVRWLTWRGVLKMPWAMLATIAIGATGVLSAARTKCLLWRGVTYDLSNPKTPRKTKDGPFIAPNKNGRERESL
jgi:hypothetical protein